MKQDADKRKHCMGGWGEGKRKQYPKPETQYATLNNLLSLSKVRESVWAVNINLMLRQGMEKTLYIHSTLSGKYFAVFDLKRGITE